MRIIKTGEQARKEREAEECARKEGSVCPCCGETKSELEYIRQGITGKGIVSVLIIEGTFFNRNERRKLFSCETCGAEWESDPY